ncbi:MAG: hypothetical protein ABW168_23095 [Sedimenticola sp.]
MKRLFLSVAIASLMLAPVAGTAELPLPHMLKGVVETGSSEPYKIATIHRPHTLKAVVEAGVEAADGKSAIPEPHRLHASVLAPDGTFKIGEIPKPHTLKADVGVEPSSVAVCLPENETVSAKNGERKSEAWLISWQEDEKSNGPLQLERKGDKITGHYNRADNGRLILTERNGKLTGYWIENESDRDCGSSRYGSRHWGSVQLKVNRSCTRYSGSWGYCDSASPYALTFSRSDQ